METKMSFCLSFKIACKAQGEEEEHQFDWSVRKKKISATFFHWENESVTKQFEWIYQNMNSSSFNSANIDLQMICLNLSTLFIFK